MYVGGSNFFPEETVGLPDLRGRVAVGTGTGDGLSAISIGQKGGSETFTMSTSEMPAHTHDFVWYF